MDLRHNSQYVCTIQLNQDSMFVVLKHPSNRINENMSECTNADMKWGYPIESCNVSGSRQSLLSTLHKTNLEMIHKTINNAWWVQEIDEWLWSVQTIGGDMKSSEFRLAYWIVANCSCVKTEFIVSWFWLCKLIVHDCDTYFVL